MRAWPGLAAVGAGLIHLGIAAGSPPLLLAALVVVGVVEASWGVLALSRTAPPLPRLALVVAAGLIGLWTVAMLAPAAMHHGPSAGGTVVPLDAATGGAVLDLAVAALVAVRLRRGARPAEPRPAAFLPLAALGAAVVAAVVIASLAGTSVGGSMQMH